MPKYADIMITNVVELGAWVKAARRAAGMTQADLARKAGVARNSVIALEQGHCVRAELGKVFSVLGALGVAIETVPFVRPSFRDALEQAAGVTLP